MLYKANVLVRAFNILFLLASIWVVCCFCVWTRPTSILFTQCTHDPFVAFFVLFDFFGMIRFLTPLHFDCAQLMQCLHNTDKSVFILLTWTFIKYNLIDFSYVMFKCNERERANVKIVDFLRFVVIVALDGNIVVAVAVASSVFFMVLPVCFVLCSLFWFHSHLGLDELLFII